MMGTSIDVLVKYIPEKDLFDLRQQEATEKVVILLTRNRVK